MKELLRILSKCIVVIMLLSGCTIQFVSKYDDRTDTNVTALQKKFDTYFINLKSESYPACSYSNHISFYNDAKIQLSGIQVRAKAIPLNDITIKQLESLSLAISDLEKSQQLKDKESSCINPLLIDTDQVMFNSIFTAILKLEIAKKRGEAK